MENIYWPLSVLSRAIHYQNLSAAAVHVGLSQPQLSRLINQLEEELQLVLLDRTVKRKSSWTPSARHLASTFEQMEHRLSSDIQEIQKGAETTRLQVGALEGLIDLTLDIGERVFKKTSVNFMKIDILDLNELDQKFLNGDLDLLFTSIPPGRKKFQNIIEVGYQTLTRVHTNPEYKVFSPFQYGQLNKKQKEAPNKTLVSNSLYLRRRWLEATGGQGNLPSRVQKRKGKDPSPVYLIGRETLESSLWQRLSEFIGEFHAKHS